MAPNKNQHYVPQCYLKSFSSMENNTLISLYNIKNNKLVESTPIKHQCSKSYFYSQDLSLEYYFQKVEGFYAKSLREIEVKGILSEESKDFMKFFWFIQSGRIEKSFEKMYDYAKNEMKIEYGIDVIDIDKKIYNKRIFEIYIKDIDKIKDLEVCIVKNTTKKEFISSDNPSVLTNKLYFSHKNVKFVSFGFGSAGALFFLPLTPKLLLVVYDSDVYSIPKEKGFHKIKSESDVDAVNYFQVMNCNNNVYMRDSGCLDDIRKIILETEKINSPVSYESKCYASIGGVEIDDENLLEDGDKYMKIKFQKYASPPRWPKFIGWRKNGFVMVEKLSETPIRKSLASKFEKDDFKKITL